MVERQAVLLIHGIGEQRPMDTLRAFTDAVWRYDTSIHNAFSEENAESTMWSKPDTVSDNFELRRLTTIQNTAGIRTDFFEFYWQHLMQGTTYGHVLAWAVALLHRNPRSVPARLKAAYWLLLVICLTAAFFALYTAVATTIDRAPLVSPWLSAIISVVLLPVIGLVIRSVIGDAARYLHVAPPNVQCRHEIRQAGVKVLTALHERHYDRIIVVGHSLGSVIGYDILTSAWPSYHRDVTSPHPSMLSLERLEDIASGEETAGSAGIQAVQRACFNELVANGSRWRVTDFVTLGSPLAHAEVLLAHDRAGLEAKQHAREFPTCLPTLETIKRGGDPHLRFSFERTPGKTSKHRVPHHAAVFAPTRWTNLYFPSRMIVLGDLIGGPLSGALGTGAHGIGVRDVDVHTTLRHGFFSHTLYWTMGIGTPAPGHVLALREALDLIDSRDPARQAAAAG